MTVMQQLTLLAVPLHSRPRAAGITGSGFIVLSSDLRRGRRASAAADPRHRRR